MPPAGTCKAALELNEAAASYAREVLDLPVTVAPFDAGQYRDQQFDAVILWHVLEHIPDAPTALAGIARILKPGGLLWIAVPNLGSWQAAWSRYAWFHLDLPRHCWHFSADALQQRLTGLGFEIVHAGYTSLDQNVYGWIQSTLNACGLPHNLLYDLIRRDSARSVKSGRWSSILVGVARSAWSGLVVLLSRRALLMLLAESGSLGPWGGLTVEVIRAGARSGAFGALHEPRGDESQSDLTGASLAGARSVQPERTAGRHAPAAGDDLLAGRFGRIAVRPASGTTRSGTTSPTRPSTLVASGKPAIRRRSSGRNICASTGLAGSLEQFGKTGLHAAVAVLCRGCRFTGLTGYDTFWLGGLSRMVACGFASVLLLVWWLWRSAASLAFWLVF